MSLDVYLNTATPQKFERSSGIFVREGGRTREITAEEWNAKNPGLEPVRFDAFMEETTKVYSSNITHNLCKMAEVAEIYTYLWRPDEAGIKVAKELIDPLREGLHRLKLDPEKYKKFNPVNGWGSYEGLVKFVQEYLDACYSYPDAEVSVWR